MTTRERERDTRSAVVISTFFILSSRSFRPRLLKGEMDIEGRAEQQSQVHEKSLDQETSTQQHHDEAQFQSG